MPNNTEEKVSFGSMVSGKYEKIPSEKWETLVEPNITYQFNYLAPTTVWYKPWTWFYFAFNPEKYVMDLREKLAENIGVTTDEIKIRWFYYDHKTREFNFQIIYEPTEKVSSVGFAIPTLLQIAVLIAAATISATVVREFFTGKPVLQEILKFLKEWTIETGRMLKYLMYAIIGGGSIYALIKIVNLLSKKKKPEIAKKPKPVGVAK